MIISAQGKIGV